MSTRSGHVLELFNRAFSYVVRRSKVKRMTYREGLQLVPADAHMRTVTYCHQ